MDSLDKSVFFTFVLQHPENRIVTAYNEASVTLVHAGKIENGDIISLDIFDLGKQFNFKTPQQYT